MLTDGSGLTTIADVCQKDISDFDLSDALSALDEDRLLNHRITRPRIRTVIAGPKEAPRGELRVLLESQPDVTIIADSHNTDVASVIRRYDPDLLVMDVRMPDAKHLSLEPTNLKDGRPLVLIAAADNRCAALAFEVHAIDFLFEPFDRARISDALEKVRVEIRKMQYVRMAQQAINSLRKARSQDRVDKLVFRSSGRLLLLDWDEIDWIGAAANYVEINTRTESYLMRESIGRLSKRLDSHRFIRIHRSIIVNATKIRELQPVNTGEYIAILKSGKKLSCSRGFRGDLDAFLAKCW